MWDHPIDYCQDWGKHPYFWGMVYCATPSQHLNKGLYVKKPFFLYFLIFVIKKILEYRLIAQFQIRKICCCSQILGEKKGNSKGICSDEEANILRQRNLMTNVSQSLVVSLNHVISRRLEEKAFSVTLHFRKQAISQPAKCLISSVYHAPLASWLLLGKQQAPTSMHHVVASHTNILQSVATILKHKPTCQTYKGFSFSPKTWI